MSQTTSTFNLNLVLCQCSCGCSVIIPVKVLLVVLCVIMYKKGYRGEICYLCYNVTMTAAPKQKAELMGSVKT